MKLPIQVMFRNMDASDAIEEAVRHRIIGLERFHPRLMRCRVVVEAPHRHRKHDLLYRVRVDLTLPGGEIVAGRTPTAKESHRDVYVAVRDAFVATRRVLQDRVRRQRGQVKDHPSTACARVARMLPKEARTDGDPRKRRERASPP